MNLKEIKCSCVDMHTKFVFGLLTSIKNDFLVIF